MNDFLIQELADCQKAYESFFQQPHSIEQLKKAGQLLIQAFTQGKKVYTCGNGGSLCDAMHFAEELSGRYRKDRKPLPAMAIADPAHITCVANDFGFDQIFSRFIEAFGDKEDILVVLSTSGKSPNCLKAAQVAKEKSMKVIALTGRKHSPLGEMAHVEILAEGISNWSDRIQEIHMQCLHILVGMCEQALFSR